MPLDTLNLVYDTVATAPVSPTAGTTMTPTTPSLWADPAVTGPYPFTAVAGGQPGIKGFAEHGLVLSKSAGVLTVVRNIDGNGARSILAGDQIFVGWGMQDYFGITAPQANLLHNGGFEFFQRTSPATPTSCADHAYGPDRWQILTQSNPINVSQAANAGTYGTGRYAGLFTQANASAQRHGLIQCLEASESIPLRGKAVRFSFRGRSSSTQTLRYAILEWTGTADAPTMDVVLDWTSGTYTANAFFLAANLTVAATGSLSVGTTAALCALRATISNSANNLYVFVWTNATVAQNETLHICDAQFTKDTFSQDWTPKPYREELANCQRYYQKSFLQGTAPAQGVGGNTGGYNYISQVAGAVASRANAIPFVVPMRVAPTMVTYNPVSASSPPRDATAAADCTGGSIIIAPHCFTLSCTGPAGMAIGDRIEFHWTAEADFA